MKLLNLTRYFCELIKKQNINDIEIFVTTSKNIEIAIEKDDIQIAKKHDEEGIGIRIFNNKRLGFSYINNLEKENVKKAIENAVLISKQSPVDEFNVLPKSTSKSYSVINLYDENSKKIDIKRAVKYALKMIKTVQSFDKRVRIDSGGFNASIGNCAIVNSNGIEAEEEFSIFTYYLYGMAVDGDIVSCGDIQVEGTRFVDEINTERIALKLAENSIKSLGAKKCKSFKGEVILTTDSVAEIILGPILFSVNSNNVQKGMSPFANKEGKKVANESLTIIDDGTISGGIGSSNFDREGVPHKELVIIRDGILDSFLFNTRCALKAGRESTGHAGGSCSTVPQISHTNVIINQGKKEKDKIIKETKEGLLINRFSGNINPVTGDFSGVVKGGFYISHGETAFPVTETLISGNVYDILLNGILEISKEREKRLNFITPYIKIGNVSVVSE